MKKFINFPRYFKLKKVRVFLFIFLLLILLSSVTIGHYTMDTETVTGYLTDHNLLEDEKKVELQETPVPKPREPLIVIDPGHGGEEWGTYFGKMLEKDVNLDISLKLGALLKKEGIKVSYTRTEDVEVGLRTRAKIANDLDATLFISIHNNKMPDTPDYKGTETLYYPAASDEDGEMNGKRLAKIVQEELVETLKTYDNGIISRPNLAVLHRTKMPAVIAEIAYISNALDRERLARSEFRQKAASALSNAVLKALQEMGAQKVASDQWLIEK
ncbi:MAG: N-acetylmuramoyl-L-alanine amidase [Clostridia bacterium]|nr:N-acetylmuramoyl-L-alanine amidase [Clostridia bacterium]